MLLIAAMGPPGGGRMVISRRLQSRFNLINMTFPQVSTIQLEHYELYIRKLTFHINKYEFFMINTANSRLKTWICLDKTSLGNMYLPG